MSEFNPSNMVVLTWVGNDNIVRICYQYGDIIQTDDYDFLFNIDPGWAVAKLPGNKWLRMSAQKIENDKVIKSHYEREI